jgi:hypothetical protein
MAPGHDGDSLSRLKALLDDPELLLGQPPPPSRDVGDRLDPLKLVI